MLLPKAFQPAVKEITGNGAEFVVNLGCFMPASGTDHGPDAGRLKMTTPRDILAKAKNCADCLYVPIVDQNGGLINDPVLLNWRKIGSGRLISKPTYDLRLYALGLSLGMGLDVAINEPDVSPEKGLWCRRFDGIYLWR